ncbi:hypothetical protein CUJ84_Chr001692 [Rhizobium leguminosarum]|jgi:hypothetical protein|uniref:Uncharacterized protein n=1 Tax=Rhizobium leguminosarum TaxID=384 RepID=A0A2K9Z1F2_RHILE|nr:hypothetical protein CUJ84_Chr001692 [Rhizobium leguminosarum]
MQSKKGRREHSPDPFFLSKTIPARVAIRAHIAVKPAA